MSLKYGLNVKKKGPPPPRRTILDDEDDEDDGGVATAANGETAIEELSSFGGNSTTAAAPPPPTRKPQPHSTLKNAPPPPRRREPPKDAADLSSASASRAHVQAAEAVDPSIFDYDSFHDAKASVGEAKKAAERQDAVDRKPKYIDNLLDAAARRKQDQLVAREKLLQREREEEGEEMRDKEKFVTGAYKEQQVEARRVEAEDKVKAEAEEKRKRAGMGGMQGFYRGMMDERDKQHREAVEAAEKMEREGGAERREGEETSAQTDAERAAEMKAKGVNVRLNDEGQITDKRDLLSAGLNVASSGKGKDAHGSDHLKASASSALPANQNRKDAGGRQAQRERQTRMVEEQLAEKAKRAREEEDEERERLEKAAKSTKTSADVSDAKARYLARKAAKERGEG